MHLSIGNIIAILSLIVAIPCTAIMSWEVLRRRQQRDLSGPRMLSSFFPFHSDFGMAAAVMKRAFMVFL